MGRCIIYKRYLEEDLKFEALFTKYIKQMSEKTLIRVAQNGIVYWIDNLTGNCYTYSESPVFIGTLVKDPFEPKTLHIQLLPNWKEIMDAEMAKI